MTGVTASVLNAVAVGHRYGFDVMEACALPSGTVYPALRRLEREGLLSSCWEKASEASSAGRPRRHLYELTDEGLVALAEATRKLAELDRHAKAPRAGA